MVPSPRPFRDRSGTVPRPPPYRRRDRGGLRTVRKPNSRMAPTFLQLAIPQLAESGRSTLRKCCACHEICTRPRESAAPATKSILDLAKVLHLPRNSNLAKPSRGRANGPVSGTVPRPFRDRSETASVQASRPRWFAHCPEAQFTHGTNVSATCYPPALLISAFLVVFFAHIHVS